jgi:hypothetical protein
MALPMSVAPMIASFFMSFSHPCNGSQFTLIRNNVSNTKHQAEADLANLDLYQRWIAVRPVFPSQI